MPTWRSGRDQRYARADVRPPSRRRSFPQELSMRDLSRAVLPFGQECRDGGAGLQPRQVLRRWKLRLVARGIDHAKKSERLACIGSELVPGHGRHRNEIMKLDCFHFVADQAVAATAQNQDGMHVLVPLQG